MIAAEALPASFAPPPADADAAARALVERRMAMLTRLAEIGMEIAEAAGRRAALAEAGEAGADGPDPALAYARVARAVRLTLALQSRLEGDLAARAQDRAKARAAEAGQRRNRIHTRVERAIEAEREDGAEVERLSSAAWERLTEADDADLLDRPIAEVVTLICADLGLSPAWGAEVFAAPDAAEQDVACGGMEETLLRPESSHPRPPSLETASATAEKRARPPLRGP